MPKWDFEAFAAELRPCISPNPLSPNHRALNVEKAVVITLYYLKDTTLVIMIANSLVFATGTVSTVFAEVCGAILKYIGPKLISLPIIKDEIRVTGEFEAKFGMKKSIWVYWQNSYSN